MRGWALCRFSAKNVQLRLFISQEGHGGSPGSEVRKRGALLMILEGHLLRPTPSHSSLLGTNTLCRSRGGARSRSWALGALWQSSEMAQRHSREEANPAISAHCRAVLCFVTNPLWASFASPGTGVTTPHGPTKDTWHRCWASAPSTSQARAKGAADRRGPTVATPAAAAAGVACLDPLVQEGRLLGRS